MYEAKSASSEYRNKSAREGVQFCSLESRLFVAKHAFPNHEQCVHFINHGHCVFVPTHEQCGFVPNHGQCVLVRKQEHSVMV